MKNRKKALIIDLKTGYDSHNNLFCVEKAFQMTPIEQMRAPLRTLEELERSIGEIEPDYAQWWSFGISHKWFSFRLSRQDTSDYLMIATFGCSFLKGPTTWKEPSISFEYCASGEPVWKVVDTAAGFIASADQLYWGKNVGMFDREGWFESPHSPYGES